MKKIATAVAVTLLGATLAIAAPHEGGFAGHHGHRGMFGRALAQKLNLSDAQKAQVRDILKASRQENQAFFQQVRATRQDFRAAKQAGDTAKIEALKPTLKAQREQMKAIRAANEAKIAQVLTPEQNAQWQQLKADWAAKRAQREQH
jgi:Spy/CpxP family protein refolding chaperone